MPTQSTPENEPNAVGQAAEGEDEHSEEVTLAVSLVDVETWQVLADRSTAPGVAPEWTNDLSGIRPVGLAPVEGTSNQFQVGIRCGIKDQDVAVLVEVSVVYKLEREGGGEFDLDLFIEALGRERLTEVVNAALTDAAPFIREIVHSMSARLRPHDPIFLAAQPGRVTDAAITKDDSSIGEGEAAG